MKPRERDVEGYFVEQVEKAGGITRKLRWLCRRGAPDRWAGFPKRSALVELKRPGRPLDPHQAREIGKLRAKGIDVFVIDSFDAVDRFVEEMVK